MTAASGVLPLIPDFSNNGHVYMTYVFENTGNTNDTGPKTSRLTRVTANPANPDVALPGSEITILGTISTAPCSAHPVGSDCIGAEGSSHTLGSVVFASGRHDVRRQRRRLRGQLHRPAGAALAGSQQLHRQDPAHQQGRHRDHDQPLLRRHELDPVQGLAVRRAQPFPVQHPTADRGHLVRRRRVEHVGGGQPGRSRGATTGGPATRAPACSRPTPVRPPATRSRPRP